MKPLNRSLKRSLLAMVIIVALILGSTPQAVLAAGETTLNVADWSATTTLANVSGRPTVLYDNGTYHMWHSNNSDMTLYYTTSTDPTNFALGTQATFPDTTEVSSPAILLENGTFYMVKYADLTSKVFSIYTSTNGIEWADAGVVYDGAGLETFDAGWLKFDAPVLLKDGDTYKLYFQMKSSATGTPYYIFMAETGATTLAAIADANDDIDFTLANANQPVLSPGDVLGAENRLMHPMVVKDGVNYYMWLTGYGSYPTEGRVFFASSLDGVNWVKGRGLEVINATESPMSAEPIVIDTGTGWHMWYLSNSARIKHVSATGPFQFSTIQAAVDAATAGDTISIAPGTYPENITVSDKQLNFVGSVDTNGDPTTTIQGTLSINLPGTDNNWRIENINFVPDTATTLGLLNLQNVNGVTIQNCTFDGGNRYLTNPIIGISFVRLSPNGNNNITIVDSYFGNGIFAGVQGYANFVTFRNSLIENANSGINLQGGGGNLVVDDSSISVIAQSAADAAFGIRFASTDAGSANNLTITGSTLQVDKNGLVVNAGVYHSAIILRSGAAGTLTAANNNIPGEVVNQSTTQFNATGNWWGSATGPIAGQVTGNVLYCNWLDAAAPDGQPTGGIVTNATTGATYCTIQSAIDAATAGDTINVAPGTYLEEVNVNKAGLRLMGAGYETTTIMGHKDAGGSNTLTLAANNLLVDGFTITRDGNNVTDWATNVKTQGVIFNQSTTGSTLQNCRVTGNRNGVYLNNTQNQTVRNNLITNNRTGMQLVNNVTGLVVSENEITNNWTMGVLFNFNSGSYTTSVQITNNNISGNWYGEIQNRWAVDNGVMSVSGNWFGNTTITTSTENSSEPGYASLIPVEFGGTSTPPSTPVAIIGGVQSAMVDYSPWLVSGADTDATKPGFQGDFSALNVDDDSPQSGAVGRIQEGVDLAAVGGTVNVLAGTYTEQVTISKEITLNGDARASIIQAYAAMPACFTTSAANRPVVCVKDTNNVTISGFTIDGLGLGNSNSRFVGVAFRNAGGTLQDNTVQDIRNTPFDGAQGGVAIYAMNDDAVARTIHVLDNTVTGFQKTGIALNASDANLLTVDIQRNTVTGAGATTVTAQNGIQVWAQSGSGVVAENTVSGIAYDNTNSTTKWVATSILNYYTDLNTTGNTITGAHMGIYYYEGRGLIDGNTLTIEKIGVYAYGINAADPPQAVPSPYSDTTAEFAAAPGLDPSPAVDEVEISHNTLTFSGTDKTYTYGIEADAGYGANDLSVNIHHNSVSGFDNGLVLYQCETGCGTGVFTAVSAVSNDLTDNTVGIYLGGAIPATVNPVIHHNRVYSTLDTDSGLVSDLATAITAENNWWGCNASPADAACTEVTGQVDADPWLVLTLTADQTQLVAGGTINLVASLTENSQGDDTAASGYVMDGIPAEFATTYGALTPTSAGLVNGAATFTLDIPNPITVSGATVSATVDGQTVEINFNGIRYLFLPFVSR